MEKPEVRRRGISPIWILPVIALSIGAWLLYKSIVEKPIEIVVHFKSAEGVTAGKTKVMYKGLPIGTVERITVDPSLDTVSMHISISREAEEGLVEDVKFWIVRPEISAGRVRGMETLLTGSYIAVRPGKSKKPCREFIGLEEPPPIPEDAPGLHIKLETDALNSLQKGSPIYFKDIRVGSIQGYTMRDDGSILVDAYIEPEYERLVRRGTRFWNASGITLKGGLNGIIFHMQSLSTLIYGGVSFYTPESLMDGPAAHDGQVFHLYKDYEDAQYGISVTLKLFDGESVVEGLTKVMYQGIEVGRVAKLELNRGDRKYKVVAHLLLDPVTADAMREKTKFWLIRPKVGLEGISNLSTLVSGAYITFVPGGGEPCSEFTVQGGHSKEILKEGRYYRLKADNLYGLDPGTPILFKHIQVGEVASYRLGADNRVELEFVVYDEYSHLINSHCVFWSYTGLDMKLTPAGIKVDTDSLQAILAGGIAFDFPKRYYGKKTAPVKEGYLFKLYDSYAEAVEKVPDLKPNGKFLRLETDEPVAVLAGSPIYYKKVQVGEVTGVSLDPDRDKIVVKAFIQDRYLDLVNTATRFFFVGGVEVKGSIRSGLKMKTPPLASMLMGAISFINPSERPGGPIREWQEFRLYPDIESAKGADFVPVVIRFPEPAGIEAGAKVRYQGVAIGYVEDVRFDDAMKGIEVTARIDEKHAGLFTSGAKVWVVKAELGLSGVRNLDAVVSGPYLAVMKGPGRPVSSIDGLMEPPPVTYVNGGLHVVVEADSLGSLKRGSPVYYKQVKVGEVSGYELSHDSRKVLVHLVIESPYRNLVRQGTVFWNASGVRFHAGIFSGIDVDTETFEAIMAGGIAFATPEGEAMGQAVEPGHRFELHDRAKDEWLTWSPAIRLELAETSAGSL